MKLVRWLRHTFTFCRWNRNPFQMWMLVFLMQVSTNQILVASSATGAIADQAREAQLSLSICNLLGGIIVFAGLHVREKGLGRWVELSGYIALTGSMGIYVWLVWKISPLPNTSFGLGLSEAFVVASLHRWVLIMIEKARTEYRYRNRERLYRQRLRLALEKAGLPVIEDEG